MTGKKSNIRPELIGELFLKPGEDIPYRLILCNTEPTAQIQRVDRDIPDDLVGISGLSGLILLKPERPILKPATPRKTRSDKGKAREKKPEPVIATIKKRLIIEEIADKKGLPDISTFSVKIGQGAEEHHTLKLEGVGFACKTLEKGVVEMLAMSGIDQAYVENSVESDGKHLLLSILKEGG